MSSTLLAFLACVLGADAKIVAPATAPAGQFILIDGAESQGALAWTVADPEVSLFVSPDSKRIVVYSPSARKTLVTLKAKDAAGESVDYHVLRITGTAPEPTPSPPAPAPDKPKPPIGPARPLPEGRFGISVPCRDCACKMASLTRKADADAIAAKLAEIRSRISSGAITPGTRTVVDAVVTSARQLPVETQRNWTPWFDHWWNELVKRAHVAKKLTGKAEWGQLFDETILGLKAVQ